MSGSGGYPPYIPVLSAEGVFLAPLRGPMTPAEKTDRARVAAMRRHRPNDPKTDELAAEFKADRLAQHIRRVVDSAPPLSQAQKDRLAVLLQPPRMSA